MAVCLQSPLWRGEKAEILFYSVSVDPLSRNLSSDRCIVKNLSQLYGLSFHDVNNSFKSSFKFIKSLLLFLFS